jgi:hypothetical protein
MNRMANSDIDLKVRTKKTGKTLETAVKAEVSSNSEEIYQKATKTAAKVGEYLTTYQVRKLDGGYLPSPKDHLQGGKK